MVVEFTREGLFEEPIDAGEKGGERLAGAGRRGNQNICPRLNNRPSLSLNISKLANLPVKPFGNERMKERKRHGTVMLPCRGRKLYPLRHRPYIDVGTASRDEIG